jgi:hypothetical protein
MRCWPCQRPLQRRLRRSETQPTRTRPPGHSGRVGVGCKAVASAPPAPHVGLGNAAPIGVSAALSSALIAWDTIRMRMPDDLGKDGQRAYRFAAGQVDAELYADCVRRYAFAVDLAAMIRQEWRERGAPLLAVAPNGVEYVHPLVRMLRDAEADAALASRAVFLDPSRQPAARGGRPMGAASAPDRKRPPLITLAHPG